MHDEDDLDANAFRMRDRSIYPGVVFSRRHRLSGWQAQKSPVEDRAFFVWQRGRDMRCSYSADAHSLEISPGARPPKNSKLTVFPIVLVTDKRSANSLLHHPFFRRDITLGSFGLPYTVAYSNTPSLENVVFTGSLNPRDPCPSKT